MGWNYFCCNIHVLCFFLLAISGIFIQFQMFMFLQFEDSPKQLWCKSWHVSHFYVNQLFSATTTLLYMSWHSFWQLRVESCDFSQAEKKRTVWKLQNDNHFQSKRQFLGPFWVSFSEFTQFSKQLFFSKQEKNHVNQFATAKNM